MSTKAITTISDHDMEQLVMLAKLKRVKVPELLRQIIRAHLDGHRSAA